MISKCQINTEKGKCNSLVANRPNKLKLEV